MLANVQELPLIDPSFDDSRLKQLIQYYSINPVDLEKETHCYAHELLKQNKVSAVPAGITHYHHLKVDFLVSQL